MSAWGFKLFESDYALDLKTDFIEMLGAGLPIYEIEAYMLENAPQADEDDACIFWVTLAYLEWEYGLLREDTKDQAREIIKNRLDDDMFLNEDDKKKRRMEWESLYDTLGTQNPHVKKVRKTFIYRTSWKLGDIYALDIHHRYVYFQIVGLQRRKR